MKNSFRRLILLIIVSQFFYFTTWAQLNPEPETELRRYFLTKESSQDFFEYLDGIRLSETDPRTGAKEIKLTDINCAITQEGERHRHIGCSWYDQLHSRDMTGYGEAVEPLFKLMTSEFGLQCAHKMDPTCLTNAEKINCTLHDEKYRCEVEFYYVFQVPLLEPEPNPEEPELPFDPDNPILPDEPDPVNPVDDPIHTQPGGPTPPPVDETILAPVLNWPFGFKF